MVFSLKYRGKILTGEIAMLAEAIIQENTHFVRIYLRYIFTKYIQRKTCKELDIEIIDITVNPDHVHLFMKYPPKYSVSFIAKRIKGKSSRVLKKEFPHLKEWCRDHLWAPSCYHRSVGNGWEVVERYISAHNTYDYNKKRD
jgi:putative transposase